MSFSVVYWLLPWLLPLPASLLAPLPESRVFLDYEGGKLRHPLWNSDFRHRKVPLTEIPLLLRRATLAAEDARFPNHGGIDFLALSRSVRDRFSSGRFTSGASTITQQLIKISSPRGRRDGMRKFREMILARQLEMRWDKDQIFEAYLNRLDYGNMARGCYTAAETYFQKPLAHLSLAESALLAGLPQGPSRLDPFRNRERALQRRNWVLGRMLELGMVSQESYTQACQEPLILKPLPSVATAGHVLDILDSRDPENSTELNQSIRTTIQAPLQDAIQAVVKRELQAMQETGADTAAVVVIELATGHVQALVGSQDYAEKQFNAALAPRSAGSTLKPFTYALALENGWHPTSLLADVPAHYRGEAGLVTFHNYDRRHRGPVLLREALACSLNVPALGLLNTLGGAQPLLDTLHQAGLTTLDRTAAHYGLGLTLGNAEVTLLELVNAYAALGRQGLWFPYHLLAAQPHATQRRIFSPQTCWLISTALSDNAARSAAFGIQSVLRLPFPTAVKTGTSTDFRDNWCVGHTSRHAVGVWVGNSRGRPLQGISGVSGAGPIFREALLQIYAKPDTPPPGPFSQPPSMVQLNIDTRCGKISHPKLTPPRFQQQCWFSEAVKPTTVTEGDLAEAESPSQTALYRLPPEIYEEWFLSSENQLQHLYALAPATPSSKVPRINSPANEATFVLDPELPNSGRNLKLSSSLPPAQAIWTSPTLTIRHTTAELRLGRHQIAVRSISQPEIRSEVWIQVTDGL